MRWVTGILAIVVAGPAAAQQAPVAQHPEVTLTEAIRRALQVQPLMVSARGEQRNQGAALRSARGAFLPTVTTSAGASRNNKARPNPNDINNPLPPIYSYSGTLRLNLDLFAGFRRVAGLKAASASLDAAEAGVLNQRFLTTVATKQAFYGALATEELVRVAESQVRRAQQQLQISIEKLRAGSATRSDSLRSTVDYGRARIELLQAQANLATAQATLGSQIGVDEPVRAVPDTALPALPDTAVLRASPLDRAPRVDQADAQARAARAQVWTDRAAYWPTFSVTYSNTRTDTLFPSLPLFDNLKESYTWSFSLSWTLFNGFAREQQQVQSSVRRDVAEASAANTRRQVNAELTQQLAALATTYQQIDIARANVAAATEDLRVQNERYRVGAATILDLLTSQAALTTAEKDLVQARFDYLIARAQLEALVGHEL